MNAKDLLSMGLGAAFLAKDKVETFLADLEERGELTREEVREFMAEAKERARLEEDALERRVREGVREALAELGLATRQDLEELKAELLAELRNKG